MMYLMAIIRCFEEKDNSVTINGLPKGRFVRGVSYAKLQAPDGAVVWVYSSEYRISNPSLGRTALESRKYRIDNQPGAFLWSAPGCPFQGQ